MKLAHLSGKTIAIMVASGFDETAFIAVQRAMMEAGAKLKIVSREAGLTNAWNGAGWGMSYPVDATLPTVLAIDYDGLIIPLVNAISTRWKMKLTPSGHCGLFCAKICQCCCSVTQPPCCGWVMAADRPHATADDAGGAPVVDSRLVTTAAARDDQWDRSV